MVDRTTVHFVRLLHTNQVSDYSYEHDTKSILQPAS